MAKPTTNPEWATDATYDSDAAPNKVEPGATLRADGWERGERPGAEHANYLLGAHGAHIDYLHAIVEADGSESIPSVTRELVLSAAVMTPFRLTGDPIMPAFTAGAWDLTDNNQGLKCPLNRFVPFGATNLIVDLLFLSVATKSAAGTLGMYLLPTNFATPGSTGAEVTVATDTTSGTAAQLLTVGSVSLVDPYEVLTVRYTPGTFTSGPDRPAAIRFRFGDPGPRNF